MLKTIDLKISKRDCIENKNEILDTFKDLNTFNLYVPQINGQNSLKLARFFSETYACEDCLDKELLKYLESFASNTSNILALENMYYTGFSNDISEIIHKRIVDLDHNLSTSYEIFKNEGCDYCPENILINIINKSEMSKKSVNIFYEILLYLKLNSDDFETILEDINQSKVQEAYDFCIKNKHISEDMILYLKECSSTGNSLNYKVLNQLNKALEIFLNK